MPSGVLVIGEVAQGRLAPITGELLGAGRRLGVPGPLSVLLVGPDPAPLAAEAAALGAERVYLAQSPALPGYWPELYLAAAEAALAQARPAIVLLGHTNIGRDLAPRLACRLGAGLAADCLELALEPASGLLVATRPVYGGSAQAEVVGRAGQLQMATLRPRAFAALEPDPSRRAEAIPLALSFDPAQAALQVKERVAEAVAGVKLEDAQIIVSGGRGLGGPEAFAQLVELAGLLGGAVGASRPPCDSGWVPAHYQVGLTGKLVAPDLYLAVAISGSSQHLAGCSEAKAIVAINKDPSANIFKVARYGIVGDYKQVLPALIAKVRELRGG
ncbi:MAG: electron transfer flavoprotein subunit alpha/FixB family protein [Chloroflexi bacterium]|nr:electron transfer flavoprotein subunit alpha/FixB family protein [Chloroflexota bacterium]